MFKNLIRKFLTVGLSLGLLALSAPPINLITPASAYTYSSDLITYPGFASRFGDGFGLQGYRYDILFKNLKIDGTSLTCAAYDNAHVNNGGNRYYVPLASTSDPTVDLKTALDNAVVLTPASSNIYNKTNVAVTGTVQANKVYYVFVVANPEQQTGQYSYERTEQVYLSCSQVFSVDPVVAVSTPTPTLSAQSTSSIKVSWSAITNATKYTVEYSTNSSFTSLTTKTTTNTSYTITGLNMGTTYYVRVKATTTTSGYKDSDYSSTKSCATLSQITLSAPSLSASVQSTSSIYVSWNSISNASSYTLAYGTTSSCSSGTFSVSGTSKTITGLSANTTYYFKVMANATATGYVSSSYSSATSATTLKITLGTPVLTSVTIVDANKLSLTFDKVYNANQYIIEYSTSSSFANKQTITVT